MILFRESARSPTFHNPLYCTELHQAVLRPFSHMSDLVLWWVKDDAENAIADGNEHCSLLITLFQGLLCKRGA